MLFWTTWNSDPRVKVDAISRWYNLKIIVRQLSKMLSQGLIFFCTRELQPHPSTFPIYLSWNVPAKPIIIRAPYLNRGLKIHTKQFSNLRRQTLGLEAFNKYKLKQRTEVWRHTHTQMPQHFHNKTLLFGKQYVAQRTHTWSLWEQPVTTHCASAEYNSSKLLQHR